MVAAGRQRGRPVEVPDHLVIGRRSSFEPRALLLLPGQGVLGFQHADAWVDAGRRSLQTAQGQARSEVSVKIRKLAPPHKTHAAQRACVTWTADRTGKGEDGGSQTLFGLAAL